MLKPLIVPQGKLTLEHSINGVVLLGYDLLF